MEEKPLKIEELAQLFMYIQISMLKIIVFKKYPDEVLFKVRGQNSFAIEIILLSIQTQINENKILSKN